MRTRASVYFVRMVLETLDLRGWTVSWEEGGGGCLHPESRTISLGRDASRSMFLHEIAHIGHLDHGARWASRFTDLCSYFLDGSGDLEDIQRENALSATAELLQPLDGEDPLVKGGGGKSAPTRCGWDWMNAIRRMGGE